MVNIYPRNPTDRSVFWAPNIYALLHIIWWHFWAVHICSPCSLHQTHPAYWQSFAIANFRSSAKTASFMTNRFKYTVYWLVVDLPLWKIYKNMSSSVGMMKFPIDGNMKNQCSKPPISIKDVQRNYSTIPGFPRFSMVFPLQELSVPKSQLWKHLESPFAPWRRRWAGWAVALRRCGGTRIAFTAWRCVGCKVTPTIPVSVGFLPPKQNNWWRN